jgi:ABC-type transporter MlaC component
VSASVAVVIRGVDAAGHAFEESTWTVGVNKQGAKVATFRQWQIGDEITIENPALGRASKAHIVRVDEKRFPKDPFEIGVELNEAENIWGVKLPPENWPRSSAGNVGGRAVEWPSAAVPVPEAQASSPPATPLLTEMPKPAPGGVGDHAEEPAPAKVTPETPSQLAGKARKSPEGHAEPSPPPTVRPADLAESRKPSGVSEAERKEEKLLRSLREQLETLSVSMRASRADLEAHFARFQELQQSWQSELTKAQESIEKFAQEAIRSAMAETEAKLRATAEKLSTHFVEETRSRLQQDAAKATEAFSREADTRLAALVAEHLSKMEPHLQSSLAQATEKAGEHVTRLLQAAVADEALEFRKQLAEHSTAALEGFRHYAEVQSTGYQTELEYTLDQVQKKAVQDASDQLQKGVQDLMQSSAQVLQAQTDDALEQIVDKLKTLGKESLDETEKQHAALTRSLREKFAQEATGIVEKARGQLHHTIQELHSQSARELAEHSRKAADAQRAALLKQFQQQVEQSCERAVADFRNRVQQAASEASEEIHKQVGVVAVMMKEWKDQARLGLDTALRDAVTSFQKQSAEVTQQDLEKHRQQFEDLLGNFRSRFQQAAGALEGTRPEGKDPPTK